MLADQVTIVMLLGISSHGYHIAASRVRLTAAAPEPRYLQTLVEMASEQNATILPIPMDIVREITTMAVKAVTNTNGQT